MAVSKIDRGFSTLTRCWLTTVNKR